MQKGSGYGMFGLTVCFLFSFSFSTFSCFLKKIQEKSENRNNKKQPSTIPGQTFENKKQSESKE